MFMLMLFLCMGKAWAQDVDVSPVDIDDKAYELDTTFVAHTEVMVDKTVVTNPFWHNWFAFGSVGAHRFVGDYDNYGKASETVTPDWFVGVGKWFTPTFGLKAEFGISNSKGFTNENHRTPYSYDELYRTEDGTGYYKQRINWWDASLSAMINLSRMFLGYEGNNSKKRMNQFVASIGIGAVHHYNFVHGNPTLNEWCGRFELGYSRFFNKRKKFSVDAKVRALVYPSNFDGNYDYEGCQKWDKNMGLAIGCTYYIKHRSWGVLEKIPYTVTYKKRDIEVPYSGEVVAKAANVKAFTFYVLYPDAGEYDMKSLATNIFNDNVSLANVRNSGYAGGEDEKLFSFADVYAAVTGNLGQVAGANVGAVNELKEILSNEAMMKITVMSATAAMDYYTNNMKQHEQNSKNVELANKRANDVLQLLNQSPRMGTASHNIMLVNDMDIKKEHCVKVTVQYLTK